MFQSTGAFRLDSVPELSYASTYEALCPDARNDFWIAVVSGDICAAETTYRERTRFENPFKKTELRISVRLGVGEHARQQSQS